MSDIQSKPNDWLVATVSNPDLGLANFAEAGLSAENTQLKDRDYYKNNTFIQDAFKNENGKFDENAFNKKYDEALKTYETFATDNYDKSYLDQLSSSFTNSFRSLDTKLRDENIQITKVKNPFKQMRGLQGFGSIEDNPLSLSEIAQQNKVYDFENGKFLDWSPNDKTGISSFFRDPLVLAQWDEDGMHIDENGKSTMHKKGDLRFNEDGDIYYETLSKRDASKKQFLSSWDTLTTDGSIANSFDIFDADDKEQSIGKTVARMALKWAPLAIAGLATGGTSTLAAAAINFNKLYLGTTALMTLADTLPMLYKSAEGILTNNEDPNQRSGLWNVMNSWQSRSQSYRIGTSEYSKNKTFTWENMLNMTSDVMLQLGQQRFIAEIPGYLGLQKKFIDSAIKSGELPYVGQQKFNDFSKMLATYYMTVTSGADAYNTAVQSGMEERTAGLVTLGTLVGLHQIMKSDIGQWPLKGIGLDDVRLAIKPVIKEESEKAAQVYATEAAKATVAGDKNAALKFVKGIGDAVSNRIKGFVENPNSLMGAALNESIEEVSEEMTQDAVFALAKAGEAMGITRKSDYTWSGSDPFGRYAMSAVGGAIGGGMHYVNWRAVTGSLDHETKRDIIYAVYKYGAEEVNKQIDQLYNNNTLAGSKTLGVKPVKDSDGKIHFVEANSESDTQAFAIKEQLKNTVNTYEKLLEQTGSGNLDLDTRRALFLDGDEGLQKLAGFGITEAVKNDLMELNSEIVDLAAKVEDLQGPEGKGDSGEYGKRLNELILEKKMIISGERFDDYFQQGLLYLNKKTASLFTISSVQEMSFKIKGKSYESLSKVEKEAIDKQYLLYKEKQASDLKFAVKILNEVNRRIEPRVLRYDKEYVKTRTNTLNLLNENFKQQLEALNIANEEGEIDPDKLNDLVLQIKQGMDLTGTPVSTSSNVVGLDNVSLDLSNVEDDQIKAQILNDHELQKRQNRANSYIAILNNIKVLKESGLPMDEEIAKKFREVIKKVNIMRTVNFKNNINTKIESLFEGDDSQRISLIFNKIPIIKDLLDTSFNIRNFDHKNFNKKIDDLTNEELFSHISQDSLRSLEYYIENEDGEIESVTKYDENLDDDQLAKEFKKDLKNYIKLAKEVIDSEYGDDLEFMNTLEGELKSTVKNPIYDYIEEVSKLTGSGTQGLFEVLANEENRLNEKNFDDFTNYIVSNGNNLQVLRNALKDIEIAKTLVADRISDPSYQSYGYVLNNYRQKYAPKSEQFTLIDYNTVGIMLNDLEHLEKQINFFIQLSMYNAADQLREHKKIGAKFMMNFAKMFSDSGELNAIRNNLGVDILDGVENILTSDMDARHVLINSFPKILSSGGSIDDESLGKAEVLLTKVEDKIFENFKKYQESNPELNFEEIFKKLIGNDVFSNRVKNDPESIIEGVTSRLSSDNEEGLTDYDKLQYIATILSSKTSDFKTLLKQHIENMPADSQIAPIFGQEYPARMAYGMILNPNLFNGANNFIKTEKGDSFYPLALNLLFINGNPGTGKTSATAQLIHSLVKAHYGDNFTVSSILNRQVTTLNESLNETKEGKNKKDLLASILKGKAIDDFINDDNFKSKEFINEEELNKLGDNLEIGKVIYIDEATHYSAKELMVLTKWANLTNRVLITFGDVLQNGQKEDIQYLNCVKSPSLEYSMRAGATIVRDNNNVFRVIAKTLNDYEIYKKDSNGNKLTTENVKNLQTSDLTELMNNMSLKYFESSTGVITGIKILENNQFDKDSMSSLVNASIKDGSDPKNIAIIYNNENQLDYQDLKDISNQYGINLVNEKEMQGSEYDYVILSTNLNPSTFDDPLFYAKSINTLFSRAKLGMLVKQNGLTIRNEKSNFNDRHEIPKEILDKFKEARLIPLRKIAEENNEFEIKVPTIEEEIQKRGAHTEPPQGGQSTDFTKANDDVKKEILGLKKEDEEYENDDELGPNGEIINPNKRPDGIAAGYLNYRTFGGYMEKDGYILPATREKGVKNLYFDLQRFATNTKNGIVTEISDQENVKIDAQMFQRYDKFVNQLYDGMIQGKTAKEVIEELKAKKDNYFITDELFENLDWDNAKFKILYTKPDKQFDKNIEIGGGENETYLKRDMIKRLVIFVDSNEDDGDPLAITVGSIGFKELLKGESDESTKLDDSVKNELKVSKNGYVTRIVDPSAFSNTGSYTRLEHKGATDFSMQDYIDNDPRWKKVTKPMIFTGKIPLELDEELLDDTAKNYKEKVERYLYEQSLNGRAFSFITYSSEFENLSDKEMITYFFNQRVERIQQREMRKQGKPLPERKYPGKITMIMLDPKSRTLNEFLTDFRKGIKEIKEGNKVALNSISNRYLGVNILKSVYELNQHIYNIPKDKRTDKERQWLNNTWQILSIVEREFKLRAITVKDSNNNKTELVLLDNKALQKPLELSEQFLQDALSLKTTSDSEYRKNLYENYYAQVPALKSKDDKSFNDLLLFFADLTNPDIAKKDNVPIRVIENSIKAPWFEETLEVAMSNTSKGKEVFKDREGQFKTRFPNGINIHPIYLGSKNNTQTVTNWMEPAANDYSDFVVTGARIEGRRIKIRHGNSYIFTDEQFNNKLKEELEKLNKQKEVISNSLKQSGISLKLHSELDSIIKNESRIDPEELSNKLNNKIKGFNYSSMNPSNSTNPIVKLEIDNLNIKVTKLNDVEDVKKLDIDSIKIKNDHIEINTKDGKTYSFKDGKVKDSTNTFIPPSPEEQVKLAEDINKYINDINDLQDRDFLIKFFTNGATYQDVKKFGYKFKVDKKFNDLLERKLREECS